MSTLKVTPGPDAQYAFRLGMAAAAVVGLVGVGALYWAELLPPAFLGFMLVICFPVYLVFAASALSVWLGFDKDKTDLRPVRREQADRSHRDE